MGCNDPRPFALRDFKVRLLQDRVTAIGDLDRRYGLLLPNGGEYTLYVNGVCAKEATVCFGFSVGAAQ